MLVYGNQTTFGHTIGVLMLNTKFPRIPGDIGNASTYDYPVLFRMVESATLDAVIKKADPALIQPFIEGALELKKNGAKAIVTSCGFMAIFQKELAAAVDLPVFTSSLLQARLVASMLSPGQKVGIITADSGSLGERHFEGVGISDIPKVVYGIQDTYFGDVLLNNKDELLVEQAEADMRATAKKMIEEHPEVGAIVLECTNMPPFAKAVQEETGRPVFDIITLMNYVEQAVIKKNYHGFL